ncbi:hypothetical protein Ddc_14347 [Ditylenchus destructor]|nr:hypothetical protein Ddc_14347 [Ditylenchus destructor]
MIGKWEEELYDDESESGIITAKINAMDALNAMGEDNTKAKVRQKREKCLALDQNMGIEIETMGDRQ